MSVKSLESVATSDEYEFVNEKDSKPSPNAILEPQPPMLKIPNNGNLEDLQNNLREVFIFIFCFLIILTLLFRFENFLWKLKKFLISINFNVIKNSLRCFKF